MGDDLQPQKHQVDVRLFEKPHVKIIKLLVHVQCIVLQALTDKDLLLLSSSTLSEEGLKQIQQSDMQLFPAFFAYKICYFKQSSTVNSTCEAYSHRPARWERRFSTGRSNAASGCELTTPTPATQHAGHSRRRQSVNTRTHTAATTVSNYHHFTRIIRDNLC